MTVASIRLTVDTIACCGPGRVGPTHAAVSRSPRSAWPVCCSTLPSAYRALAQPARIAAVRREVAGRLISCTGGHASGLKTARVVVSQATPWGVPSSKWRQETSVAEFVRILWLKLVLAGGDSDGAARRSNHRGGGSDRPARGCGDPPPAAGPLAGSGPDQEPGREEGPRPRPTRRRGRQGRHIRSCVPGACLRFGPWRLQRAEPPPQRL